MDEVERRLVLGGQNSSPQLRNAWCLVKGITLNEVLRSKSTSPQFLIAENSDLFLRVINLSQDQVNGQLRTLALTAMATRYYINTSTEQAEKMGLMAFVSAKKAKDDLWLLVSGKLLAGILLSQFLNLILEVYEKQDKLAKKGKQDVLNDENRRVVRARLRLSDVE